MAKVVLGFSGGVDSAVAAKRLMEQSYQVHGLFLDVGVDGAMEDAVRTARWLGLPLEIRDCREMLNQLVCEPFLQGYLQGKTLNPCLLCNPVMKLQSLLSYADAINAEWIATGHYARARENGLYIGHSDNDQSYQLCLITQPQLNRLLLPLGDSRKADIRAEAEAAGIPIARKPDSMDICFIPDHDYAAWLERRASAPVPGEALFEGQVIGKHEGIHRYTVGQRWQELYHERRLYVSAIRPETNQLELVLWDELFHNRVTTAPMHWLVSPPNAPFRAQVRVRHTRWEMPDCTVTPLPGGGVSILTDTPLRAPARGQTAALYDGHRLLGGGEIL